MLKVGTNSYGYTIVEVMIFLAVSSLMFLIAVGFISGKQNNVEFTLSVNTLKSDIQQVFNNVSSGYYASRNNFSCRK